MTPPWLEQLRAVTPRWFDGALWAVTHVDDMAFALAYGAWASWTHPERPIYAFLPKLLADPAGCGRPARVLPRDGRYVVASDHHLLYATAPHDYFGGYGRGDTFRNEAMYAAVMRHYGDRGFTLIENGDVEDLVVTEPQHDRTNCLLAGVVGRFVYHNDDALRRRMRLFRLWRVVRTYAGYYQHLLDVFGADRVVKLVGNHDVELLDPEFRDVVPLGVPIHEFAVIPAGADGPAVIVCHGHQMDPWTCEQTARGVGESITESFAWLGQGADRIWRRTDWSVPVSHDNVAVDAPSVAPGGGFPPKVRHMGEQDLLAGMQGAFPDGRPWLVLGHTHEPRMLPADRYVNGGAVGRYQDLLWLVEIERGTPQLVAWWARVDASGARLIRATLAPGPDGGTRLVTAEETDHGPVPTLPYGTRPTLGEVDAGIPVTLPQVPLRWLLWRTGVHVLGYGGFLAACAGLVHACVG